MIPTADAVFFSEPASRNVAEEVLRRGGWVRADEAGCFATLAGSAEFKQIMSQAIDEFAVVHDAEVVFAATASWRCNGFESMLFINNQLQLLLNTRCSYHHSLYGAMDIVLG